MYRSQTVTTLSSSHFPTLVQTINKPNKSFTCY